VQRLSEYDVHLPETGSFVTADLSIDTAKTLQLSCSPATPPSAIRDARWEIAQ
jgi:hypothetical protein